MRLPRGDVLVERARIGVGRESLAQLAVAQHLCELGQDAQVLLGRLLRHQQQEHEADGLAVGASNGTGCARRTKAPTASLSPLILPCGIATPCPSPVEPRRSRANRLSNTRLLATPWLFFEQEPGLLEHAFLARHIQVQKDVRRGQELRN